MAQMRGTKGTVLFVPLATTPSRAIFRGTKRTVPFVPLFGVNLEAEFVERSGRVVGGEIDGTHCSGVGLT